MFLKRFCWWRACNRDEVLSVTSNVGGGRVPVGGFSQVYVVKKVAVIGRKKKKKMFIQCCYCQFRNKIVEKKKILAVVASLG